MTIVLYDLISSHKPLPSAPRGRPLFSPYTVHTRLALLHKGIKFETKELTYRDMRFGGWKEKLGVDLVTVPFIEREDGSFLMDSTAILFWLEEAYPNRPSILLPEHSLPVEIGLQDWQIAKEDYAKFKTGTFKMKALFPLYAPITGPTLDKEGPDSDFEYWTCADRLGEGEWDRILKGNRDELISDCLTHGIAPLESILSSPPHRQFFSSPTKPGAKDFYVMGLSRFLGSTSQENLKAVFGNGRVGEWYENMLELYDGGEGGEGMRKIRSRDPQ